MAEWSRLTLTDPQKYLTIKQQIKRFHKQYRRPMPEGSDRLFYVHQEQKICAVARFVALESAYWLRGLFVAQPRQGMGTALVHYSMAQLQHDCYAFALPHLETFYQKLHFETVDDLPEEVAHHYQRYQQSKPQLMAWRYSVESNQSEAQP